MVTAWLTAHAVELIVGIFGAILAYRHRDEIREKIPAGWPLSTKGKEAEVAATDAESEDAQAMIPIAAKMFGALTELRRKLKLSPPGRAILLDGLIFYERPIMLYPDSPERKAALDGRKAMLTLFSSAPPEVKPAPKPPAPPAPPAPEPPAVT